jgi:hypothetical protein
MLEKTEWAIKQEESRDMGNDEHKTEEGDNK